MKIATFESDGHTRLGLVDAEAGTIAVLDVSPEAAETGLQALLGPGAEEPTPTGERMALSEVRLLAPLPRPIRNIFCIGKNYRAHAAEVAASVFGGAADDPPAPIVFSKPPQSVIGPGAAIEIDPAVSEAVDYEAELAVIVGRGGRGIRSAEAMDHVWGYTLVNDVTARDLQKRHGQWLIGKGQDTFCPMGPWAVSRDEVDLAAGVIRGRVNGELRQEGRFADLIFDVPTIVAAISAGITLLPGDVIATGTPAGVGIGFDPPRYLRDGDVVRVEVDGIGALENPCRLRG